jgi:hypothetical protein
MRDELLRRFVEKSVENTEYKKKFEIMYPSLGTLLGVSA